MCSHSKKNRRAFTLIEVMVAAILISIVGLSLMQMHQKSAQMSHTMQMKFQYSDWILMSVFESDMEKTRKRVSFEALMKPFNINDDSIRKSLDKKAEITTALFGRIDASDIIKEMEKQSDRKIPVFEGLRLEVYAQNVQIEHEGYLIYRVIKP
ncbi:MAG: prepilin-type N-terminal cleavage/methylation domain-containing protein [Campylobacterales bacterium]|nr:prepilin-type N-terminal cleavage/methylation domain-containing protein [Campylobacterales bacterium]